MDNDNKIKIPKKFKKQSETNLVKINSSSNDFALSEQTKDDVLLFLQDEVEQLRKQKVVTTYNLEKEYAKTKKNKNISVWLTLACTVIFVVGLSWLLIRSFSKSEKSVNVTLEAFEDLNLRNLFDALSKTQDLYEKATKTKAELQTNLDQKLLQAKQVRDSDLEYIRRLKLSNQQLRARENSVYKNYSASVQAAHSELDEKINAADLELKQYEQQLKSFDSEHVAKAQEWEKQMDSERQVHEIEKNRLVQDYETRIANLQKQMQDNNEKSYQDKRRSIMDITNHYDARIATLDPTLKDSALIQIIQTEKKELEESNETVADIFDLEALAQTVNYMDEDFLNELDNIRAKYDDYVALNNFAKNVPYSNGMAEVLKTEKQLAYEMILGLAKVGTASIENIQEEKNQVLAELENYKEKLDVANENLNSYVSFSYSLFESYAEKENVDGIILDAKSLNEITSFFKKDSRALIKNDGSTKVAIFNKKQKVATGAVWFKNDVFYISLDQEEALIEPGFFVKFTK